MIVLAQPIAVTSFSFSVINSGRSQVVIVVVYKIVEKAENLFNGHPNT